MVAIDVQNKYNIPKSKSDKSSTKRKRSRIKTEPADKSKYRRCCYCNELMFASNLARHWRSTKCQTNRAKGIPLATSESVSSDDLPITATTAAAPSRDNSQDPNSDSLIDNSSVDNGEDTSEDKNLLRSPTPSSPPN